MNSRVLVDTGPLVAFFSARDQYHSACVEQLKEIALPMLTCWPVLVEATYLLRSHLYGAARFALRLFQRIAGGAGD